MKSLTLTALTLAPLVQSAVAVATPAEEAELRAANHAYVQAWIAADRDALARIVDEDFRFTSHSGDWLGKRELMQSVAASAAAPLSYDDVRVRLFGDVALVHGLLEYRRSDGGAGKTRYTDVYRRAASGAPWRLVSAQLSEVSDPSAAALRHRDAPVFEPWRGPEPQGPDEAVLTQLNAGYVQAFLDSDVAWYARHVSADYLAVFSDGSFHDKDSLLHGAAAPVTAFRSFPVVQVAIRRFGDVALIHAETPYERHDGRSGANRYTDIWHKRDGRWLCIAAHVTRYKVPA
jgi:ketosteroid isomerase-like protein